MKSIFQKLLNLQDVCDIEKLINGNDFQLVFNKTYFDQTQNKILVGDSTTIDNNKNFLDLYMSQEFIHLKKYFENIESRKTEYDGSAVIYSETPEEYALRIADVKKAKSVILKIFNQISYYKGTAEYILFFLRLFVKLKNYDLYDKTEVNVLDSYYYSVTANCSLEEWDEIVKPIVHPVGFNCFFVNINGRDFSSFIQTKNFNIDTKKNKLDIGFRNFNLDYYDNLNFEELASVYKDNFPNAFFSEDVCTLPIVNIDKLTETLTSLNGNDIKYLAVDITTNIEIEGENIKIDSDIYTPTYFFNTLSGVTILNTLTVLEGFKYILLRYSNSKYSPFLIFSKAV